MYMKKLLTSYVPCLFYYKSGYSHVGQIYFSYRDAVSLKPRKIPCAYGEKNKV